MDRSANNQSNQSVQPEDRFLWDNLRLGNKEAFEVIYRKHVHHLYNYGIHVFMDKHLVEDAIQDVFVTIWRRKEFLGETDSIRFYLLKALKREIIRKVQVSQKEAERQNAQLGLQHSCVDSIENELVARQLIQQKESSLIRAIDSLPERQRKIIVHRFYDNLSAEQISSKMSLSIDSTYTLLSRAVRELRKNVKKVCLFIPFLSLYF